MCRRDSDPDVEECSDGLLVARLVETRDAAVRTWTPPETLTVGGVTYRAERLARKDEEAPVAPVEPWSATAPYAVSSLSSAHPWRHRMLTPADAARLLEGITEEDWTARPGYTEAWPGRVEAWFGDLARATPAAKPEDVAIMAAAPDLARLVGIQADEIAELRCQLATSQAIAEVAIQRLTADPRWADVTTAFTPSPALLGFTAGDER